MARSPQPSTVSAQKRSRGSDDVQVGAEGGGSETRRRRQAPSHDNNDEEVEVPSGDTNNDVPAPPKEKRTRRRKRKRGKSAAAVDGEENAEELENAGGEEATGASKEAAEESPDDAVSRTIFVEGIPYDATEEQVRCFFGSLPIASLRLPRWQDTGRLRGFGHVEFETIEDRQAALQLSGRYLEKHHRYLTLQPAKQPKDTLAGAAGAFSSSDQKKASQTLLLKNLSYDATEEDVEQALSRFGEIVADGGIRIARHNRNRLSKGFAFCEFASIESAQKAVQHQRDNGPLVIRGRPCALDYDHGCVRKSFRTETGRLWQKQYGKSNKKARHHEQGKLRR